MNKAAEALIAIAAVTLVALGGWDLLTSDGTPHWAVLMAVVVVAVSVVVAAKRFWAEYPKPTRAPFRVTYYWRPLLFGIGFMLVGPVWGLWEGEGDPVNGVVMFGIGAGSLAVLIRHLRKPIDPERRQPVDPDDHEWGFRVSVQEAWKLRGTGWDGDLEEMRGERDPRRDPGPS